MPDLQINLTENQLVSLGHVAVEDEAITCIYITKASFAGLELPRLLNEVEYSNIRGEQRFFWQVIQPQPAFRVAPAARASRFSLLGCVAPKICRIFGGNLRKLRNASSELKSVHNFGSN